MRIRSANKTTRAGLMLPALVLCLGVTGLQAGEAKPEPSVLAGDPLGMATGDDVRQSHPYPLVLDHSAGLDFDLGGSETQKLQLQLAQPLSLHGGTKTRQLDSGSNLLGLDATLNLPVTDNFNLSAGVDRRLESAHFQALGSIQCSNGTLRADSYTASGCRFVNEPIARSTQQRINLGAHIDFSNVSASINWFKQEAELNAGNALMTGRAPAQPGMGNNLLSPNLGNPLLAAAAADPMQFLNSEASGVDLNFKVGIATSNNGDVQLGLAFARVLDAEYQGLYSTGGEALSWTVAEPFNSARMNLEWHRGAFATGVQGFYRDSVDFLNRNSIESLTTFDVYFTWRTPWNANLTVGASNVMNAGADNAASAENQPVDPMESVYGRIPYVRYKQDL